jgi:hypothetical protein
MLPDRWVLVESFRARKEGADWMLEDMALIRVFVHAGDAWKECQALHEAKPGREFCVLSTLWEEPKVEERFWFGARAQK